jgi:hypothetical protein
MSNRHAVQVLFCRERERGSSCQLQTLVHVTMDGQHPYVKEHVKKLYKNGDSPPP